ncbi:MAG: glycerol dehydrogenase [Clostridiaceae bacterium]
MIKLMRTPSRYVQGPNSLTNIKEHTNNLGKSFLVISSKTAMKHTKDAIVESFKDSDSTIQFELFNGQCSNSEIKRIREIITTNKIEVIVGVGGGRTLDTAKAVAYYENIPVVICPTVAATDAPCTALSVVYNDEGNFENYLFYPTNPNVVIVDTAIIAAAPIRFLVAGMGDALGTFFEARTCYRAKADNLVAGKVSEAGYAIAKLCYETLLSDGFKAKATVEAGAITEAVERAIEATTYLSGVGAENGGLSTAHSVYNGFTILPEAEKIMHGELVAFGTVVQAMVENFPMEEIEEIIEFCLSVGLPITLKQMGLENVSKEDLRKVADATCAEGETIHNTIGDVTSDELFNAILAADSLGNKYI